MVHQLELVALVDHEEQHDKHQRADHGQHAQHAHLVQVQAVHTCARGAGGDLWGPASYRTTVLEYLSLSID